MQNKQLTILGDIMAMNKYTKALLKTDGFEQVSKDKYGTTIKNSKIIIQLIVNGNEVCTFYTEKSLQIGNKLNNCNTFWVMVGNATMYGVTSIKYELLENNYDRLYINVDTI